MAGRIDAAQYHAGLAECLNCIPLVQGGVTKRPGTDYIGGVKHSANKTRLVSFVYSTVQAYIIEFGDLYIRFYKEDGQILNTGVPVEVSTPYLTADLFDLRFIQDADTLWILHENYHPMILTRTSHISWQLLGFVEEDGPYMDVNTTAANTMTPSNLTGMITVTTAQNTFVSTDAGRLIRFLDSAGNWTWMKINTYISATSVTALIKGPDIATLTASDKWRLGAWSITTGFPSRGVFHENRLVLAGNTNEPYRVDMSNSGNYWSFAPSEADGTVTDANSISFPLVASEVNAIKWLESDERGLVIGTDAAEWLITPASTASAATPTNVSIKRVGTRGSTNIESLKVGKNILFTQRSKRKVREMAYSFPTDGFDAADTTQLSEHITGAGITELVYQQEPATVIWAVRTDGKLIGAVYDPTEKVIGWHIHDVGGIVESIAVIPNDPNGFDELFMIVNRTINGATVRYVEDLDNYWIFQSGALLENAIYSDSSILYSGASTSTLTGLNHLEGEDVTILGDGLVQANKTVSGGQITLDTPVTKAVVGLPFTASIETMREVAGARDGTAQSKTKRIHRVAVRVDNSQNISLGPDTTQMEKITHTGLTTGDVETIWPRGYDSDGIVRIEHSDPLPLTVSAIIKYLVTYDR